MSQPRSPQPKPATPPPAMPGVIAVAVVLLVAGIVVGLIIGQAAPSAPVASPTVVADSPTVVADSPTAMPATAVPAATTATSAPDPNVQMLPTATTRTYAAAPAMSIDPAKKYIATIITPRGNIVIELLPAIAPQTVNNFVFLVRENFYNGLTWHRVLPNFMAQGGDPNGDGTGNPGYSIPAEFTDTISFNQPGIVAMARSNDPDSAGSQFFITTGDASWLDGQYTIFGRVTSGQEIVMGIPLRDPQNPADTVRPGETILGITISEE
ncbi:peptidylprolyl isomerase [Candidatus Oscillochloris fontis]|uniref:peptidylprolyl isomerase n=1 Tax=Candidatus Oscillochloris fontis TaxID=2496868 RepID=UPI001EE8AFCA|nr:peptidylprolyl isomerase [Candidatus Oscillochloris fontis]